MDHTHSARIARKHVGAVLAIVVLSGCATVPPPPNVTFTADDLDARTRRHEDVAVLPFVFESNRDEQEDEQEEGEASAPPVDPAIAGRKYQRAMYSRIMEFKDEAGFTAAVQDVDQTNAILARDGRDIHTIPREELSSLLGVDAVLSGSVTDNRLMSGGTAFGVAILTGLMSGGHASASPHTQEVCVRASLHDGADGEMLWSFEEMRSGGIGSSTEKMIVVLMARATSALPYVVAEEDASDTGTK